MVEPDPIAVVGLAFRFPQAETMEEFWAMLSEGRVAIKTLPDIRRTAGFPSDSNFTGGFVDGAETFDPLFFGISAREACQMDPQQRFVLETAWNALEDAAIAPSQLSKRNVGVFMGVCHWDYLEMQSRSASSTELHRASGISPAVISNRVSYFFDFNGPSVTNDTACSSSLVAIEQAVQALRSGACSLALAGGANLIWSPDHFMAFSKANMLSKTGCSRAFDHEADGYVRGEGAGIVVLKKLSDAVADRDPIRAVIRAVASNHGGKTAGLTVTNPDEQAALIERVMTQAGAGPDTLDYVEAHGTGTPLGDPIEVRGLKLALEHLYAAAKLPVAHGRTAIGSVKNNIGHLEGAAGIAGVAKVIAAMQAGKFPPLAGFEKPNPLLRLDQSPLRLAAELEDWPTQERQPRRAGVSSFGFGGTNAHALIEEYIAGQTRPAPSRQQILPFLLSGATLAALERRASDLLNWLEDYPDADMRSVAATLLTGREALEYRAAIVTKDREVLLEGLRDIADGRENDLVLQGAADPTHAKDVFAPAKAEKTAKALMSRVEAWLRGITVDWPARLTNAPRLHLPQYRFDRASYWFEPLSDAEQAGGVTVAETQDGAHVAIPAAHPFLAHHIIAGSQVLPGMVTLDLVVKAALIKGERYPLSLRDVVWQRALVAGEEGIAVDIVLTGDRFLVTDGGDTIFARGRISAANAQEKSLPTQNLPALPVDLIYDRLVESGIDHGPAFKALRRVQAQGDGAVLADLALPLDAPDRAGRHHPILLDAAIQSLAIPRMDHPDPGVPFALDRLEVFDAAATTVRSVATVRPDGGYDIALYSGDACVARLGGLKLRALPLGKQTLLVAKAVDTPHAGVSAPADIAAEWAELPETALAISVETGGVLRTDYVDFADIGHEAMKSALWQTLVMMRDLVAGAEAERVWVRPSSLHLAASGIPLVKSVALENGGVPVRIASQVRAQAYEQAAPIPVDADQIVDGVFIVTGGTGRIGQHMIQALRQAGASAVVACGRTAPDGADDLFFACDVADRSSVRRMVRQVLQRFGRLDGVIHCAGVIHDGLARTKDQSTFDAVLTPKVDGLCNLDAETANLPLRFIMVASTVAAVHGAMGQSDYAAANAAMDVFMNERAKKVAAGERDGRSLSIGWSLWADGGMQVTDRVKRAMTLRMGTAPLPTDLAISAFLDVVNEALPPRVVVGFGDGGRFLEFLRDGDDAEPNEAISQPAVEKPVAAAQTTVDRQALLSRLREFLAETLGLEVSAIRSSVSFERYGFDSLLAVEMVEKIEKWIGEELSSTLFFETLNLDGVVDHLIAEHGGKLATVLGGSVDTTPVSTRPAETSVVAPTVQTREKDRDIAVVGLAGRYPGAQNLTDFWESISNGKHNFTPIPEDRWPHSDIYFPDRDVLGKSTIMTGGFLDDIDKFDPRYFNISQADAECMSPEVRLLLECAVETFEQAGYSRETLHQLCHGDVGVLVGTMSNHYNLYGVQNMLTRGAYASGSYTGTMPNMISYFYGLTGPSIFVDTMCSASLTALDLAVRLLREGQCRMVLAGGVNLLLHPFNLISSSQEHFTSNRAEIIRSFGLGADGTILGEGVGTALLKPLNDAERDGDLIQAVIKGTGMSNAGPRNGFTVPSPAMQARAVNAALKDAGLSASDISYIEAHGSGTKLGDPIEIRALTEVFGNSGEVAIGSVKSNIAHLLAAAGIAGFSKLVMQLRHGQIAPSLHSDKLNPAIEFANTPFTVNQSLRDWPAGSSPRRGGITSIGAGGMNNHMIVEEYPASPVEPRLDGPFLMVFSATSHGQLCRVAEGMRDWINGNADADPARVAYTLQVGRTGLRCRMAMQVETLADLVEGLGRFLDGDHGGIAYCADVMGADLSPVPARLATVGGLEQWIQGEVVDWLAFWPDRPQRIELPTYPFEKVRCWYEVYDDAPDVLHPEAFRRRLHPFIGRNVSTLDGVLYETRIRPDDLLDYVSVRNGTSRISPLVLADAALAALSLAGRPVSGLAEVQFGASNLALVEGLVTRVTADCQVLIETQGQTIFAARSIDGAPRFSATRPIAMIDTNDAGPLLEGAGISHHPYHRGLDRISIDKEGRFAGTIKAAAYRQDHDRKNTSIPPEALTAIEDAIALVAKSMGIAAWDDLDPAALSYLGLGSGGTPVALDGRLVTEGAEVHFDLCLRDDAGGIVAEIRGLRVGSQVAAVARAEIVDATDVVRGIVAEMLKFDLEQVDTHTRFYDFGYDSITLAALAERVNKRFLTALTPAVFYDVENIEQLVTALDLSAKTVIGTAKPMPVVEQVPVPEEQNSAPAPSGGSNGAIAIIGMACRFPGADGCDAYWDLLSNGRSALGPVPMDRYTVTETARVQDAGLPPKGGFLSDIDRFDADFFQISPTEADVTDPQHRLVLETAWQALEDAAVSPLTVPVETGVYIGISGNDYREMMQAAGIAPSGYTSTGTSLAMVANRLSYLLNLTGPSSAIDTACSSSLVAVHRAAEALRSGQCAMAIAGGVNITLSPDGFIGPMSGGMLSPDGECRTFSARANGYVRGEGVGMVVLKRLDQAVADGDPIHAVIEGSAENHGGRSGSLTAPRTCAQRDVILAAMKDMDASRVAMIEAHGTGTPLGDPVELDALNQAYGQLAETALKTPEVGSIVLGAVKPAIGHLEAAAGIAGFIKLVLCRKANRVMPSLLGTPVNPYLNFDAGPFRPVAYAEDWPDDKPLAGVSSFGFGGVNAHVVIGPAPAPQTREPAHTGDRLFMLSAQTKDALCARAADLARWMDGRDEPELLDDIAATLANGRAVGRMRAAIVAASRDDLRARLVELASGVTDAVPFRDVGTVSMCDPARLTVRYFDRISDAATAWMNHADVVPAVKGGRRLHLPVYRFGGERRWYRPAVAVQPVVPATQPTPDFELVDMLIDGRLNAAEALNKLVGDMS